MIPPVGFLLAPLGVEGRESVKRAIGFSQKLKARDAPPGRAIDGAARQLNCGRMIRILALLAALAAPPALAADQSAAYFGFKLINSSQEPVDDAELARLAMVQDRLREKLVEADRYSFVDTAAVAKKADLYENLAHCNGCDAALAKELGADVAITAEVQKTSNLILSMSIFVRDAQTGDLIGGGSADMRGNTDDTWRRAVDYIVRNRMAK
jgi:hypothetical protein